MTASATGFSIIICTYNNAHSLRLTLDGIGSQCWTRNEPLEVVVINNNSTDHTSATVADFSRTCPHLAVREVIEPHQGLVFARERGLRESRYEYLAFVDDDCLLRNDWAQRAFEYMVSHPQVGVLGGRILLKTNSPIPPAILPFIGYLAVREETEETTDPGHIVGAGMVLRRAAVDASRWSEHRTLMGRRGKALSSGEDTELCFRIRNAGYLMAFSPALELEHVIPERRLTPAYMRKLLIGIGRAQASFAIFEADGESAPVFRKARNDCAQIAHLLWHLSKVVGVLARLYMVRRPNVQVEREIQLYYLALGWGNLSGAVRLPWLRSRPILQKVQAASEPRAHLDSRSLPPW